MLVYNKFQSLEEVDYLSFCMNYQRDYPRPVPSFSMLHGEVGNIETIGMGLGTKLHH